MVFFSLAIVFLLLIGVPQLVFMFRRRSLLKRDWSELVSTLEPVNMSGISAIAEMYLSPTKDQLRLEPPVMWKMLGGLDGVQRLRHNAEAMLELCVIAENWDQQGAVISEMIRRDLVDLKKAVTKLEIASLYGLATVRAHFALLEVAADYHLIRARLLGQYEKTHIARLPMLQARLTV